VKGCDSRRGEKMAIDIEKTTYHETDDGIWRIDSGEDLGELWNMDVFEQHALDYIRKEVDSPEEFEERKPRRESEGSYEILEAELRDREYRLIKDHETDEFYFMFYKDADGIEDPASYVDSIWEDEIETILGKTAREKILLKHEMEDSDRKYRNRLSKTI
jgi:hypothetical protein